MPTSLVTGIAGFIGSHLADSLLAAGHKVIGLDDLSGGTMMNVPKDVSRAYIYSINDKEIVEEIFAEHKPDYVFHLAAYAAEGLSHFIRRYNYENNLLGSINLINAAVNHGTKRFIFTSSMAVYGTNQTPFREDMTPAPEDPYGIAKYAVERDLACAHELFGLNYTIFRPHNVYGERQHIGDTYRNVVGIFMNQILRGEPMTVFGDGEQVRAFSHISDVAPLIAESISLPAAAQQVFNIGGDDPYTINELAEIVSFHMGAKMNIRYLPPRHEVHSAFSSHKKLEKVFGKRAKTGIDAGIKAMAAWAKERGPQEPTRFEGIEIMRGLPGKWL